ncbi:hypothetical protein QFC19_009481 [Naganishia cerealis]|uniref:Uncharacterized protein n=1 Tax=Naganishia cerealis TaxID=610337 RepID=A0ACC2UWJ2_9TREE|nr:hypothetical protein QFC19_009481 [Naganishia cerealis]
MTVRQNGNRIMLLDSQGVPLFCWQLEQDALLANRQMETIVARLETIARAQHLLRLKGGTGESALEPPLDIQWGQVENGEKIQLPDKGATLRTGQSIYVSLHNTGSSTVFVSIFDIGITGNITLLSYKARGVPIPAGGLEYLGDRDFDGTLLGLELSWPDGVPKEFTGYEAFAIVSTSEEHDLTTLQTTATQRQQSPPRRGNDTSELLRIVDQISCGGAREASPQQLHGFRYDVKPINFELEPSKE